MDDKRQFEVISTGAFVAGFRSPGKGKTLQLTDDQSFYPLIHGEIKPVTDEAVAEDDKGPGRSGKKG